jgi:hypothetical protein
MGKPNRIPALIFLLFCALEMKPQGRPITALPDQHRIVVEAGPLLSNEMDKYDIIDLDGPDNIYGETDITQDGYYFNAGVSREFNRGYGLRLVYTHIKLNKNKLVEIGDSLSVDDLYPVRQHQFYASGTIPAGKNYSVLPAFNFIMERYKTVMPRLAPDSVSYHFPVESFSPNYWIGYLSVTRDFQVVKVTFFGAVSDLNEVNQYQGGFRLEAVPFGSLNFYASTRLLDHINNGDHNLIFEQVVGARPVRSLLTEVSATIGTMENYHESCGFVVYNIDEKMTFKGEARLVYSFSPRWSATVNYLYLVRDGEYIRYELDEDENAVKVACRQDFQNQIILLGLNYIF